MFRHINKGIISRCVCIAAHFDKWGNQEVMDSLFSFSFFNKFETYISFRKLNEME